MATLKQVEDALEAYKTFSRAYLACGLEPKRLKSFTTATEELFGLKHELEKQQTLSKGD